MCNVSITVSVHCESGGCTREVDVKVPLTPKSDREGYTKNHLYVRETDVSEALAALGWRRNNFSTDFFCPTCVQLSTPAPP